jgi:UDP-N-acetylglucosamine--N-acetylmuramyl-(pentapeptide) pyrophosphoryl-undecaprenol N-acetylglucosamine transferase
VFAAGGTGGHLYPAIAVADSIKKMKPEADILFVGTKHKLESKVIPSLGYKFKSIVISGFSRKTNLSNLLFPFKLIYGSLQSLIINFNFKPKVAVGAGAYVAGPVLWSASILGSKILLMEQNSYPGITEIICYRKSN